MFKPIQVPNEKRLIQYFKSYGLNILLKPSKKRERFVNEMKVTDAYKPELKDLYLLHQYTLRYKRTTILEFGTGWSSLVFANALEINKNKFSIKIRNLRRNNPFELHCLDNEKKYLNIARKRLSKKQLEKTNFHYSEAEMTTFNGRICTQFKKLPLINPDLIYLDGPDQFNIKDNVSGFNLEHKDMMPMSCDILKFEHFLTPGTIIITDGRAANARFLKTNFQRDWKYLYDKLNDQHLFYLKEPPLGKYNSKQLDFYFKKSTRKK